MGGTERANDENKNRQTTSKQDNEKEGERPGQGKRWLDAASRTSAARNGTRDGSGRLRSCARLSVVAEPTHPQCSSCWRQPLRRCSTRNAGTQILPSTLLFLFGRRTIGRVGLIRVGYSLPRRKGKPAVPAKNRGERNARDALPTKNPRKGSVRSITLLRTLPCPARLLIVPALPDFFPSFLQKNICESRGSSDTTGGGSLSRCCNVAGTEEVQQGLSTGRRPYTYGKVREPAPTHTLHVTAESENGGGWARWSPSLFVPAPRDALRDLMSVLRREQKWRERLFV
jgi:hypothetical protein